MPDNKTLIAMLLRLEIGALGLSNRALDMGSSNRGWHVLLDFIDYLLHKNGVPIHQPRLQNEVPVEFLASMLTLDEAKQVVTFLEDRERRFKKFLEENKL